MRCRSRTIADGSGLLALFFVFAAWPVPAKAQDRQVEAQRGETQQQETPTSPQATVQASVPPPLPVSLLDAQQTAEWLARLNRIAQGDWFTARSSVGELAGLPPGQALAQVRALWPSLSSRAVKREILLAFLNAAHPDTLRVLMLAVGETDPELVKVRQEFTRSALLLPRNLSDAETFSALQAGAERSLADVRRARLSEIARALETATPEEMDLWSQVLRDALDGNDELRQQAVEAGIVRALLARVARSHEGATFAPDFYTLYALQNFVLTSEQMQTVILPVAQNAAASDITRAAAFRIMAHAGYAPGYAALKAALPPLVQHGSRAVVDLAQCLAEYGQADSIPLLIGLIASDNTYDTLYHLGWFGLTPLTGVAYNAAHDGNWWKLWWERNRAALPERVGYQTLPEFSRTARYQEPLSRELHLDPEKYRLFALDALQKDIAHSQGGGSSEAVERFEALPDPRSIPTLIGMMAADNHDSLYRIGYLIMDRLYGIPYSPDHDGNWWRLWWDAHRNELPANVGKLSIPDLPHSERYQEPLPLAVQRDPALLRDYLLAEIKIAVAQGKTDVVLDRVQALVSLHDPQAIAPLIDLYPDEAANPACYPLGWFGLKPLTGEMWSRERDKPWWRNWLMQHRAEVEKRIAGWKAQPTWRRDGFKPSPSRATPPVAKTGYAPRVAPRVMAQNGLPAPADNAEEQEADAEDVAEVPSQPILLHHDPQQKYRLVGFQAQAAPPRDGYKLLVVLPGNDGGEGFRDFVRRIKKNALPADMLIAQVIAPKWSSWQAKNLVWPTRVTPFYAMRFPTEALLEATIADVKTRTHVNASQVYALAWSSSGPAVYTALATKGSSLRGAFVAMSVFRSGNLPDPSALAGRRVFLYHSPQDFIRITQAREAQTYLEAQGAAVQLLEYAGGHGWTGDVFGDIRTGLNWLIQTPTSTLPRR